MKTPSGLIGVLCAALVLAPQVRADTDAAPIALPPDAISENLRSRFLRCRVALFYEREAAAKSLLPPANVEAMGEQIDFIMADTLFNLPALSLPDAERRLAHIEDWTIRFSREIGAARDEMRDPERRGDILLECQPLLWAALRDNIDTLIRWRARAMALENAPRLHGGHAGGE